MTINGLKIENQIEEKTTIYKCPYCQKKFLNKNSYRRHIGKNYCYNYFIDFEQKTQQYKENKITKKEYYLWCYEKGYIEFLNLTDATKEELGNDFFKKICDLYNEL